MFILLLFLPDRPTHLHERKGDGKRNLLKGWLKGKRVNGVCATKSFRAGSVVLVGGDVLKTKTPKNPKTPQDPN